MFRAVRLVGIEFCFFREESSYAHKKKTMSGGDVNADPSGPLRPDSGRVGGGLLSLVFSTK